VLVPAGSQAFFIVPVTWP